MDYKKEMRRLYTKWKAANAKSERTGEGLDGVLLDEGVVELLNQIMYCIDGRSVRATRGAASRGIGLIEDAYRLAVMSIGGSRESFVRQLEGASATLERAISSLATACVRARRMSDEEWENGGIDGN